jgi:carnosine N-methyltransferase
MLSLSLFVLFFSFALQCFLLYLPIKPLLSIVNRQYRSTAHLNVTHRRRQAFYALPSSHWKTLAEPPFSLLDIFNLVDDAIDANADIADAILAVGLESFGLPENPEADDPSRCWHGKSTPSDVGKAQTTIRQFYRDWSVEGREERDVCYSPVLQFLTNEFGHDRCTNHQRRVLVPGAGLGRLVFDICQAGFAAEGNEISYHQLLASSWILNHTLGPERHALYPFAQGFSNLTSRDEQLRKVMIPDVHPHSAILARGGDPGDGANPSFGTMSMTAADFAVLYTNEPNREAFSAVATVFFIDTAPNLIRYLEAIHHCLKPGGIWINIGPLLWHFGSDDQRAADHQRKKDPQGESSPIGIGEPGWVELVEDEVVQLVKQMGFQIERYEKAAERPSCGYIQDPESMFLNLYRPSRWMARKVASI